MNTFSSENSYEIDLKGRLQIGPLNEACLTGIIQDGRILGILLPHILTKTFDNLSLHGRQRNEVIDNITGNVFRVKSSSTNCYNAGPSSMGGANRHFSKDEFINSIRNIDGFMLIDTSKFPTLECYCITDFSLIDMEYKSAKINNSAALIAKSKLLNKVIINI